MASNVNVNAPPAPAEPAAANDRKPPTKEKLSKAAKKRLKQLAAQALKRQLKREQLIREVELTKKSLKRGKLEWEDMCAKIKLKELREEIEDWGLKTEELMEKKDFKIQLLVHTIDETQEVHEKNYAMHLSHLKYLANCHQTLRQTAAALFEMQASDMVFDFMSELSFTEKAYERNKINYENVILSSNVAAKARLKANYDYYLDRKYNGVSTEIETRYILRDATCDKMRRLQDNLLLWIKRLQGDMVDVHKTERFLYFMKRQRNYVRDTCKLTEIELTSRKTITDLQQELLNIEAESNRDLYGLKLLLAYFAEVREIIKNAIERDQQVTHQKLLVVASESYRVVNKLKEFVKFGELLLSLGVCCRKYKTEKEKILQFNSEVDDRLPESEYILKMKFDLLKFLDISEEELSDQMGTMKNFWRRCSNVRLHNIFLNEEKRKLNEENERYRNIIRSMKKSDDVKYILEALAIYKV